MTDKKLEGLYSTITLVDTKTNKRVVIGTMAYLENGSLLSKFRISEDIIKKKITPEDSQIESLMVSAYLCKMRVERLSTEKPTRANVDSLMQMKGSNVLFGALEPFKSKKKINDIIDDLFAKAIEI